MTPSSSSNYLPQQLTELRETLTYVCQFIKGNNGEYRQTARWRETQSAVWEGACGMVCTPSRSMDVFNLKFFERRPLGIFLEASSRRHDASLNPFSNPLSSQENEGWGWKFQAPSHGLFFLVTSPHPGATQSHLIRTKGTPMTHEITRASGALC